MLKLLSNPERCRRMGEAARTWVLEYFIDGRVLGLTAKFYQRLFEQATAKQPSSRVKSLSPIV
jgi:hypothetical protein